MSSLHQYDGWTVADIVEHNSHELTACQILSARQFILDERRRHESEMTDLRSTLDAAQRVGLAVMRAKRDGRKTVRIDEVSAP